MKKSENILVAGASGQLGSAIIRKLIERHKNVIALVRPDSSYQHLSASGVEVRFGDLTDAESLKTVCQGIDVIIATANSVSPRQKGDNLIKVDILGYYNLIEAAKSANVQHFIYCSAISFGKLDDFVPISSAKRKVEKYLMRSGLNYTIFRPDAFMDISFAFLGTELPLQGAENATLDRPFKFSKGFFNGIRKNMEVKSEAGIIGTGQNKHSFICIDDVAAFHAIAVDLPEVKNSIMNLGGPEALSMLEVVQIFEKVLGKKLVVKHTPAVIMKLMSYVLKPFNPAASNIMALNYATAKTESHVIMEELTKQFGIRLTSAEEYLRLKSSTQKE
ncbi:MAG: SDR family oxidoreductase [Cyclobacteriaceae bacterium]|nr:SDR family oxidoreductase [Cyclobacteriaceae bacterium]